MIDREILKYEEGSMLRLRCALYPEAKNGKGRSAIIVGRTLGSTAEAR